ncbi:hypothetical protein Zmor_009658 [Zophobas morio]|uniref:Uncharacterized protein n=1 Tax=Zophobas morio TaxID=2755281 RepID=A0AA38IPI5_9CUCU|nr:hypothetical protein Zmor_009658 [Zophobas morio]
MGTFAVLCGKSNLLVKMQNAQKTVEQRSANGKGRVSRKNTFPFFFRTWLTIHARVFKHLKSVWVMKGLVGYDSKVADSGSMSPDCIGAMSSGAEPERDFENNDGR